MDKKQLNNTIKALEVIVKAQQDCAAVSLTIGTTTKGNMVVHGGIYISDCPASVIEALQSAGFVLQMDNGKLNVAYYKEVSQ